MKIVTINNSDSIGGAAIVARRLNDALNSMGVEATMLVINSSNSDATGVKPFGNKLRSKWNFLYERLVIFMRNRFSRKNLFKVSIANTGYDLSRHPDLLDADIIILNWINQGVMSLKHIEQLATLNKPVVSVLHDLWFATGICHHPYECTRFANICHSCGYLKSNSKNDLSTTIFKRKRDLCDKLDIQFVAVSNWVKRRCSQSALLSSHSVEVIHNAFPIQSFSYERRIADKSLNIPINRRILVMGAARLDDPIKGFDIMIAAMNHISESDPVLASKIHLVLYGNIRNRELLKQIKIPFTYLGVINGVEEIAKVYSYSDIVLSTSLYETLGGTLIEGQAAGCIPVSFGEGGQADIVEHLKSGYIAQYKSPESIADGIRWALESNLSRKELHDWVKERFSQEQIAKRYMQLFHKLINERNN
ncbi:MAG: glycosyltransferase [Bacteroidales bacterium]